MKGYKTEVRKLLLNYFESIGHRVVSSQMVYDQLKEHTISLSSIYRNLAKMEKEGILCKMTQQNSHVVLYQYVNPKKCHGIVHLKCKQCDMTYHLNEELSHMITNISKQEHGFSIGQTTAVLYGKCTNCQDK